MAFNHSIYGLVGWLSDVNEILPHWIMLDFGVGNQKTVTAYGIYCDEHINILNSPPENHYVWAPTEWVFQGSNNGSSFVNLHSVSIQDDDWNGRPDFKKYAFSNATPYRYYRLYVTKVNTSNGWVDSGSWFPGDRRCQIEEITMYE